MIITRTPMRVPLGGGGTDLPSYYRRFGGSLVSAAIDKYMYIDLNRPAIDPNIRLKYSKTEIVADLSELQHGLAREALRMTGVTSQVEISSMADFPSGTGMGSSGSYAVGLLKALHTLQRQAIGAQALAEEACHIEIDLLGRPIGKQDQYVAAFGGFVCMDIERDGEVRVEPLGLSFDTTKELENDVLLYYTGTNRDGLDILAGQNSATERDEAAVVRNLHEIKEIGQEIRRVLRAGDVAAFGRLLDDHWRTKKKLSHEISNPRIDRWYDMARDNGALGGKIMGAGGGGFFLFCVPGNKAPVRKTFAEEGLIELNYRFDFDGSKVLLDI